MLTDINYEYVEYINFLRSAMCNIICCILRGALIED